MKLKFFLAFGLLCHILFSCAANDDEITPIISCDCFDITIENGVITNMSTPITKTGNSCDGLQKIDLESVAENTNVDGDLTICSLQ